MGVSSVPPAKARPGGGSPGASSTSATNKRNLGMNLLRQQQPPLGLHHHLDLGLDLELGLDVDVDLDLTHTYIHRTCTHLPGT